MRNKIAKQLRKLAAEDAVHADHTPLQYLLRRLPTLRPGEKAGGTTNKRNYTVALRGLRMSVAVSETPAEVLQRVTKSFARRFKSKYKKLNRVQRAAFNHS